jgi:RNA polymerase sigma factor (sigma-70 family)
VTREERNKELENWVQHRFLQGHMPPFVKSPIDREEVVQMALSRLSAIDPATIKDARSFRQYGITTLRNCAVDLLRGPTKSKHVKVVPTSDDVLEKVPAGVEWSPEGAYAHQQAEDVWDKALNTLPRLQRQILYLSWREEMSCPEIARNLGLTENKVYKQHRKAVRAFTTAYMELTKGVDPRRDTP